MLLDHIKKATLKVNGKDVDFKQHLLDSFKGPNGEKPVNVTFELVKGKDDTTDAPRGR